MVTRDELRAVCGRYATGITVATVFDAGGQPHGVTINSFTSVSLAPPMILFCLDTRAMILAHFEAATHFAINILSAEQQGIASRFARPGIDRFEGVEWTMGETGTPLLKGTIGWIQCALARTHDAGDHRILLGEVRRACIHEGEPLLYFGGGYRKIHAAARDAAAGQ